MTSVELPSIRTVIPSRPSDRWNSILVKEVRQALRGKTFRFAFLGTLVAALLAAMSNTFASGPLDSANDARELFVAVYFCLAVAVLGVVPFGAFQAMGSEWDESTYDLLSLSNLRPRHIVLGKLQSALVQAALFASAIVPFLTMAFLLPGIDLLASALILAGTFLGCVTMTLFAIALSTLTRHRFLRVVLMIALGGAVSIALPATMAFTVETLRNPRDIREIEALLASGTVLALAVVVGGYTFGLACNMLAHFEENRSSNIRIVTTAGALVMLALVTCVSFFVPDHEFVTFMTISGLVVISIAGLFFATERRALGRRVRHFVPSSRLVALVTAPWFPGGGRGVVLHVLHVLLVALWGLCLLAYRRPGTTNPLDDGVGALLLFVPMCVLYVTLVPGLFARLSEAPLRRGILRVATPTVAGLVILVPGLVGAFVLDERLRNLDHLGNPFLLLSRAWRADGAAFGLYTLFAGLAALALLVNLPRIVASVRETLEASAENERRADAARTEALGDARTRA